MKDTLEYKILKYLKENDNGEFINMKGFIENEILLESKLNSLSKKPDPYISFSSPIIMFGGNSPVETFGEISAKIEFNGIKYLSEIEKEYKNIVNIESFIGGNNYGNQSSNFSNSPQTINTKANIQPIEKKNIIKRFWKLISENKLISGILLIVILFLIKLIFGIDLKNP